jgi:hypothetical protein
VDLREYTGKVIVGNGRNYSKYHIRAVNGFGLRTGSILIWDDFPAVKIFKRKKSSHNLIYVR